MMVVITLLMSDDGDDEDDGVYSSDNDKGDEDDDVDDDDDDDNDDGQEDGTNQFELLSELYFTTFVLTALFTLIYNFIAKLRRDMMKMSDLYPTFDKGNKG